ncbi:hypothetical protein GTQ43_31825 [Nostoc sp. KVJ3]|uniref:hypothetical protein n=1 Tax=Nostoc sp. KVJ3 TaxID=457945 RepID=UPI0022378C64|nr:hypothetical protein [Nostoc sp. KVJ3]MCW5318170.1 hypothetical protein [Nostoc sp. KVJ3]
MRVPTLLLSRKTPRTTDAMSAAGGYAPTQFKPGKLKSDRSHPLPLRPSQASESAALFQASQAQRA